MQCWELNSGLHDYQASTVCPWHALPVHFALSLAPSLDAEPVYRGTTKEPLLQPFQLLPISCGPPGHTLSTSAFSLSVSPSFGCENPCSIC